MNNIKKNIWSKEEVAILKKEYATCSSLKGLAFRFGCTVASVKIMATNLGLVRLGRLVWTEDMDAILRDNYPCKPTFEVAEILGLTTKQVLCRAKRLGLHKNPDIIAGIRENGMFLKGHVPFNKGMKQHEYMSEEVIQKTTATRFKKGQIPVNIKEIGYERISVDGYVEVKTEKGFVLKHRMIWEKHNGPIPKGHIVRFKNRNKLDIRIENLELVTCAQNMKDNTIHNYPPEIKTAMRRISKLKRMVKKYEQTDD